MKSFNLVPLDKSSQIERIAKILHGGDRSIQQFQFRRKKWHLLSQIAKLTISCGLVGYSVPVVAATCTSGGGAPDPNITEFISAEVFGGSTNARMATDTLDDAWRNAILPQTSSSWTGTNSTTIAISNNVSNLFTTNGVDVGVALVNVDSVGDCLGVLNTVSSPQLSTSVTLQGSAPRPSSLPAPGSYWTESGGSNGNRNGVLFTFSRPVSAFGAWFGDLETRANGGIVAILRLIDTNGNRIGRDIPITPTNISNGGAFSLLDQIQCGGSADGCGNNSTRWVGFVDATARVKQALVIVGDKDPINVSTGNGYGNGEGISFIGANLVSVNISGTVFEDKNYGGGSGRSLIDSAGIGRPGATVELYDKNSGVLKGSTTTNANGKYFFSVAPGTYIVRVVNSTVTSSRPATVGYVPQPVQTFRTTGDANNDNVWDADLNRVGGEDLKKTDAIAGSLATSTTTIPQSVSTVVVSTNIVTGVDFGFNFDTIVNTNNSGQGSLSQFITNSNALNNTGLDQDPNPSPATGITAINPAPGEETSIFMIPSAQLTGGVANINVTSLLPQITGTNAGKTVIDGRTQTINIGNTNTGTLGAVDISNVGVDQLTLDPVNRPEVQITGLNTLATGLDIQADNVRIEGIAILKFGRSNTLTDADIYIGSGFKDPIIKGNVIGTTATSFTNPGIGATDRSNAYGVLSLADGGKYQNNLIGFHGIGGLELNNVNSRVLIEKNEIRGNAIDNSNAEGTNILSGGGATVSGNLFIANGGPGIDTSGSSGGNIYVNNTITGNGIRNPSGQTSGMRILGSNNTLIDRNLIYKNYGSGILVRYAASNVRITKNSIYENGTVGTSASGQIGIDLVDVLDTSTSPSGATANAAGTTPFFTLNDNSDADIGGNRLLNFPVLESARITGSNLVVKGFAPAGAAIELFISDNDSSKFGEGKTYLATVIEGSATDLDTSIGDYGIGSAAVLVNGINQGTEISAKRFNFVIPLTALAANPAGQNLTATATVGNTTSEFGGLVNAITSDPQLVLVKRITAIGTTAINTTTDDTRSTTTATNDNNSKWPLPLDTASGISNILKGSLITSKATPNQEIEYTIYFLSAGNVAIKKVNICDRIPVNTTYVGGSGSIKFGANSAVALSNTDVYKPAGAISSTTVPGIGLCKSTASNPQTTAGLSATENPNGLIWVQVDKNRSALATGEYGYIRFRVLTKP